MKTIFVCLVLVFSVLTVEAKAAPAAECISKKEMQEIASNFKQFKDAAKADYCYDGSDLSNLLQSLMFMRKSAFAAQMPKSADELFSGRFAKDWYGYFVKRITDIDVQDNCPKGVGAYVYGWGSTMYVCPMLLKSNFSALDRASVFMHEARHIDGYPHVTCTKGPRQGISGACDSRISDGGSYAVSVETYAQLAKYSTDLHPALKAYAMNAAVGYADEAFETPAKIQREDQLLVMGEDKKFYAYDFGKNKVATLGETPALGKIVLRGAHKVLFPDDREQKAGYVFLKNEGEISQGAGDVVLNYNASTPAVRSQFKDLHAGGQWSALVNTDAIQFTCSPYDSKTETLNITNGTAVSLLYFNGFNRSVKSAHLLLNNGRILEIGCTGDYKAFMRDSFATLPGRYTRAYKLAGRTFALSEQGEVFDITNGQAKAVDLGLGTRAHEISPMQVFSFIDEK